MFIQCLFLTTIVLTAPIAIPSAQLGIAGGGLNWACSEIGKTDFGWKCTEFAKPK
jgi:hypothetical protein